jgi:hypothetical protein
VSTVDPLQAALGGEEPEPSDQQQPDPGGNPEGAAPIEHPVLGRFGGDVRKALDAYAQLDSEYGRQGDRLGKQVSDLQAQLDALQSQQTPEYEGPDMGIDQLREWYETDPLQASAYLMDQNNQMLLGQIQQALDQRLTPVEQSVGRTTARDHVENLKTALGQDVVARNAQVLVDLRQDDPDLFQGDPQKVFNRMKTAVLAAEAQNGASQRRASQDGGAATDVAVEGGSRGRNPQQLANEQLSPEEEFISEMDAGTVQRDVFGNEVRRQASV